jgi:glycogen synthase
MAIFADNISSLEKHQLNRSNRMRILLLTNEYPPNIYGGAGVHVQHVCHELVRLEEWRHELQVMCFGSKKQLGQSDVCTVAGAGELFEGLGHEKLLDTLYRNLIMTGCAGEGDIVHCHTWYSYLAGCLLKPMLNAPLVITVHSLEPQRPWKREQLGRGFEATCWLERTALQNADGIIAVSSAMKADIIRLYGIDPQRIRVIYNGIDAERFQPVDRPDILKDYGIDATRPYVLFVGRITRQKGILHLVDALPLLAPGVQAVLCAGAPDTPAIAEEMRQRVQHARQRSADDIIWIEEMVPVDRLVALYSHAQVFICPSIYEPFGIINLEAMACGVPVVGAAVGGIPEIVREGQNGVLVPFESAAPDDPSPKHPQQYARDLATAINALLASAEKRKAMGQSAREWVQEQFSWQRIAAQTLAFYRELHANR